MKINNDLKDVSKEEMEDALKMCIEALYEAIQITSLDRMPTKAVGAIQQAQAVLGL